MLPKKNRLVSSDFKQLRGMQSFHSPHFLLRVRLGEKETKAAAVVSVKVARTAVARNLLRRRIYAALAPHLTTLPRAALIITAKTGAAALSFQEITKELAGLLKGLVSG